MLRNAPLEYPSDAAKQLFTAYFENLSLTQSASLIPSARADTRGLCQNTFYAYEQWLVQQEILTESHAGAAANSGPDDALLEAVRRGQATATIAVLKNFERYYFDLKKYYDARQKLAMGYLRGAVTYFQLKRLLRLSRQNRVYCDRMNLGKLEMVYIHLVFKHVYEAALVSPSSHDSPAVLNYLADHCPLPNIQQMAWTSIQANMVYNGSADESMQLPP
ncbi:hypothetical protein H4R34_000690 [Dimargaris verticillata]|uniref:Uncharacterized protein n=1 Tax=Dimargaris verticillata TaxID=2761393 RepID=A0A9W8BC51_9FUNG|nr:hypothetical protein H4R34_000690 [Dimargaris verticillata]